METHIATTQILIRIMPIQINSSYTLNTNISQLSNKRSEYCPVFENTKSISLAKIRRKLIFWYKTVFNPKQIFPVILNKNQNMKILIFVHQMGNISFINKQKQSCGAVMTKVHFRFPIISDNG